MLKSRLLLVAVLVLVACLTPALGMRRKLHQAPDGPIVTTAAPGGPMPTPGPGPSAPSNPAPSVDAAASSSNPGQFNPGYPGQNDRDRDRDRDLQNPGPIEIGQDNKKKDREAGLIKVESKAEVDVETDKVKVTALLKFEKYAPGYGPKTNIYASSTDGGVDATATAESSKSSPSKDTLKYVLLELEKLAVSKSDALVDFLRQNKAKHIESSGIKIQPIYESSCSGYTLTCVNPTSIIVGYRSTERISFEVKRRQAQDVIKGAIEKGAWIEKIKHVAGEDNELEGELRAKKKAVFEAALEARAVARALEALNQNDRQRDYFGDNGHGKTGNSMFDDYGNGAFGDNYFGSRYGDDEFRFGGDHFGFKHDERDERFDQTDLELVLIACKRVKDKDEEKKHDYYDMSALLESSYSSGDVYSTGSGSSSGDSYDSFYNSKDYQSSYGSLAHGIVEEIKVRCQLIVRANDRNRDKHDGPAGLGMGKP